MNIAEQVEELKMHFDSENIINESNALKLTPQEYTAIRLTINKSKKDGLYTISGRVSLQLEDSIAFIVSYNNG
jgi:hypothetical protein